MAKVRLRFGVDVDGVLYQWDKTARYMLRTMKGYSADGPLGQPSTHWNSIQEHVSKEDWAWLWNSGVRLGLFRYGHLYTGAIEGVRALSGMGDVVVITHRPRSAVQDTLDWLSYLKLPFTETHLLTSGQPKSQVPHCDFYVDDKPDNISDFMVNTKGIACLMRRPWNQGFAAPVEASNWEEVVARATNLPKK
jgi:5'(3')-deoxyribonucleotidase